MKKITTKKLREIYGAGMILEAARTTQPLTRFLQRVAQRVPRHKLLRNLKLNHRTDEFLKLHREGILKTDVQFSLDAVKKLKAVVVVHYGGDAKRLAEARKLYDSSKSPAGRKMGDSDG